MINKPLHYETEFIRIQFIIYYDRIEIEIRSTDDTTELATAILTTLGMINNTDVHNLLIDCSLLNEITDDLQSLFRDSFAQQAFQAGIINFAFVLSQNVYNTFDYKLLLPEKILNSVNKFKFTEKQEAEKTLARFI